MFKDYSPWYRLDSVDVRTKMVFADWDNRVSPVPVSDIRERVDESVVSVEEFDMGHGAIRFADKMGMLESIVSFFDAELKSEN